jgi:hypothetical protein
MLTVWQFPEYFSFHFVRPLSAFDLTLVQVSLIVMFRELFNDLTIEESSPNLIWGLKACRTNALSQ